MSTFVYMKILESVPRRYDMGIRLLTLGGIGVVYDEAARAAIGDQESPRVLEIGCGTGSLTERLVRGGARVVAVDQSADMLAIARHKLEEAGDRVDLREQAAVEIADLPAGSFDAVASTLALSEMTEHEQDLVLRAAHHVLRPGGRLVIADEVLPESRGRRWVHAAIRLPLAVLTWLVTQTSTRPARALANRIEGAGFTLRSLTRPARGGVALAVAERPPGPTPLPPPAALLGPPRGPDWLAEMLWTCMRWAPIPVTPGLRAVGDPDARSPVLLTGNYDLTVRRVLRALRGRDAWLVVADSHGVNVWCAASGGHLTTHNAVTALRLSGLQERVRHRRVVLPQLCATGIEARPLRHRSGFAAQFGPADAADLPGWLDAGRPSEARSRRVRFGPRQRLEMAVAWAAPAFLVAALPARHHLVGAFALIWGLALVVFYGWEHLPGGTWSRRAAVVGGAVLLAAAGLAATGGLSAGALAGWAAAAVATTALLTFDYEGSTPIEAAGIFEERAWQVALDTERCTGVYRCASVCPEDVFTPDRANKTVRVARLDACIRCGACVVQCPTDALSFAKPDGERVGPETIRRYKLNLLGKRR